MAVANPPLQRSMGLSPYLQAALAGWLVIAMTTFHHIWGAVLYETPSRLHIIYVAIPVGIVFSILLWLAASRRHTAGGWAAAVAAFVAIVGFCSLAIGLYEGGYNHVLKNLVYFSHGPVAWMFPDGITGIPDNFVFEASGVAQLPTGVLAALASWRMLRWAR